MATARTADTWRESGGRGERRAAPRMPHPDAEDHVARVPRPPLPPRPAARMASTDLPPLPEHLARLARSRGVDPTPSPASRNEDRRPPRPGRPAQPSRPVQSARPLEHSRPVERPRADREDLPPRGRRPAEPRATRRPVPVPERGGRLRGAVAVVVVFLACLAGAAVDSFFGSGPGLVTLVALTAATALATLAVRRRDLVTMVVAPPLVYIAAAAVSTAVFSTASLAAMATLLVRGFPTMAIATAVALVLALIRWAARR
ncbi:hypothetical protein GCU56_08260 [Geodermatophilus sabuli]|uniref:DUF6542 domain-containing protein n=1 Tax=Geodermatophilus sabuli TaxID=1564158 RepID=A0A7K3W0I5_9ACTN|nr:DUF6542 domain-containing protein [Geodermatophilus sabuli]NEK57863.1 hypothetical protein [Geodermatophilus sabuli]